MAIVKMKKLRLIAVSAQREDILRELMLLGCVEISEPPDAEGLSLTRTDGAELSRVRAQHAALTNSVKILDKYAPEKKKLLAPREQAELSELLDETRLPQALELADRLAGLDEQVRRISAEEGRIRSSIEAMTPWRELDLPLDFKGTDRALAVIGSIPAAVELSEVDGALGAQCEEAQLFRVSDDKSLHYVLLVCLREKLDEALSVLRPLGFAQMSFPDVTGTALETVQRGEARLAELSEEKARLAALIADEAGQRQELKLRADTLSTRISRAEAASKLVCTQSAFVFQGWIPAADEAKLEEKLAKYDCAWETEDPDPEKPEEVPIKLRSNALTEPMTMLTQMYSMPAYNGVDPNPLMLPFFPLYFGIMFADMGYGLLLALAGVFMKLKMKPKGGMKYFSGLMIQGGVMAFIFGALTGGFFGDSLTWIAGFMGKEFALPALINPMEDTTAILVASLVLGMIQLLTGVIVNGVLLVKDGKKADAFWAVAPVFVVFGGLGLGVLGVTWLVAIAGVVMVIYAEGRASGTIGGKLGSGLYGLYNFASGWFGDILSYSRLMALMLAGSVVAQVFNSLGAMGGPLLFVVVFILGHVLNMALNLIGCFVHSLRLQYLEFFGKFYREGGREFDPLAIKTNYVDIKED